MKKYQFLIISLIIGVLVIPFSALAVSKVKILEVRPKVLRQNDTKILTIKGDGFQQGAKVNLGEGITVVITSVKKKEIKAQIIVDLDASTGKRTIVVTNPKGKKGKKIKGLSVKECITDCETAQPFEGNIIPIHDTGSSQYRKDCTNASCHRGILKEISLDTSIKTFHVLKLTNPAVSKFFTGKTTDAKCLYCHKSTDAVEHSAGSLRKNVDVSICYSCHSPGNIGKEFYKE